MNLKLIGYHLALLGRIHRKERLCPDLIRPAQPRRVVQEPNQVTVEIQFVLLCGFNQVVGHSIVLGWRRLFAAI